MRLPIAAFFLLATLAIAQTKSLPPTSSYEQDETAKSGKQYPPELVNELTALREAALADEYAYRQVAHLTENIGPRPSGSLQAQAAVDHVAEELRKLGLEVRLEEVRVPHWIRGIETAELVEYPGQAAGTKQKIVLTALGASTPTSAEGLTAEVVVVNNFDELKNLGRQGVAGKIVLFNTHFDKEKAAAGFAGEAYGEAVLYRAKGAKAAAELGAIASLVRSVGGADYRLPHTGWGEPAGIPAGAVTSEDADLIAHLAAQGKVRMHVVLTSENAPEVLSYNVVADLKGSEHPEQVVIVSGHLDSWDLGASHPLGFSAKISANALPWLKPAQEILRSFGANLIKITDQSPGSDIAPMAKAGIPALGIMQDGRTYFNYHHTAADTLDKIVPRELRENAAAMAVMGYALANLPETLPR